MTTMLLDEYKENLLPVLDKMFRASLTPSAVTFELVIVEEELAKLVEMGMEINLWAIDMVFDTEEEKEEYMKYTLLWKDKGDMIGSLSEKRMETLCKGIDFEKMFKEEGK